MASEEDFVERMYDDFMDPYFEKGLMLSPHAIPPAPDGACIRCLNVLPLERPMPVCEHVVLCVKCDDEQVTALRNPELKDAVMETICANFCMVCRKKEEYDRAMAHQQMWDTYDANKYKMQSESRRIRTELRDPSLATHSACSAVDLHINSGKDYWTNPFAPDEDSAPASA